MSDILRFNFVFREKSRCLQVAAEKNTGKMILRCNGFFGMENEIPDYNWDFIMDEGDWDKLMYIIGDADAEKWEADYVNESVEDAAEWSLEIHVLGKHTLSEGYNKFPPQFEQFKAEMIGFLRMKRRQLHPDIFDFRYLAVAEQTDKGEPMVLIDSMEKTFSFYNLLEDYEHDGTYFMNDGDWNFIEQVVLHHKIFEKFKDLPYDCHPENHSQFSISLGYKPGQITQRYTGFQPAWWREFSKDIFSLILRFYKEGRKSADQNFNPQ